MSIPGFNGQSGAEFNLEAYAQQVRDKQAQCKHTYFVDGFWVQPGADKICQACGKAVSYSEWAARYCSAKTVP